MNWPDRLFNELQGNILLEETSSGQAKFAQAIGNVVEKLPRKCVRPTSRTVGLERRYCMQRHSADACSPYRFSQGLRSHQPFDAERAPSNQSRKMTAWMESKIDEASAKPCAILNRRGLLAELGFCSAGLPFPLHFRHMLFLQRKSESLTSGPHSVPCQLAARLTSTLC